MIGTQTGEDCFTVPAKKFQSFVEEVADMDVGEIVDTYGLPYADAETLAPALSVHASMLAATDAKRVTIPLVSLRNGLLLEVSAMAAGQRQSDFSKQVIASARALGRKYHYDEPHAQHVAKLGLKLFDQLKDEHTLGRRERLLLEVAAILHDIGVFIGNSAHHKHSSYLVRESDLFGLRKTEKELLAEVVRYHRKAIPKPTHLDYMSLPRQERVVVSKLAAILRIADALDRAHQQRVNEFSIEKDRDQLLIRVSGVEDLSIERSGLRDKGDLFEDIFGVTVTLEEANRT
jgi:exopolyphosphatase/guanosine-5'-triphosphate,3'-diphosphate pyrophosphatase